MKSDDMVISPVGAEDPIIHTISMNGVLFNAAIQLKLIVLIGEATNERRPISVDTQAMIQLFKGTKANGFFNSVMTKVEKIIVDDTIKDASIEIKNIAYDGIKYFIVYYLLVKQYGYDTRYTKAFAMLDNIIHPSKSDVQVFADSVTRMNNVCVGSKLYALTRGQMLNSNDLKQPIWKLLYINSILRSSSMNQYIDWTFMRCVAKQTFTDISNVEKSTEGSVMRYIRSTAIRQEQLAKGNIKQLANQLKEAALDIDYTLDDIALVVFDSVDGVPLSAATNRLHNFKFFESIVDQYLQIVSMLVKLGIIHNDPTLRNATLIGDRLVLVNYDKAILSSCHHAKLDSISIGGDLLNMLGKKTISDNIEQVFNCYAAYDIIRFIILMKRVLDQSMKQHHAYLDTIMKISVGVFKKMDAKSGVADTWVEELLSVKSVSMEPTFISPRRKHASQLRNDFITQYVQSVTYLNE